MDGGDRDKLHYLATMLAPLVQSELAKNMGPLSNVFAQQFAQQVGPNLMRMLSAPVKVVRVVDGDKKEIATTIPQLLAELIDSILDLTDVMIEDDDEYDVEDLPQRRKRKKK
jgi:hypothetical protein